MDKFCLFCDGQLIWSEKGFIITDIHFIVAQDVVMLLSRTSEKNPFLKVKKKKK